MVNCLATILAIIVIIEVQKIALSRFSSGIPFFKRYVDDIGTSILADKIEETITVIDNVHPRLNFTI